MSQIVVSFAKKQMPDGDHPRGISFVALSRVRRLQDLLINHMNFDDDRLLSIRLPTEILEFDKITAIKVEATKLKISLM